MGERRAGASRDGCGVVAMGSEGGREMSGCRYREIDIDMSSAIVIFFCVLKPCRNDTEIFSHVSLRFQICGQDLISSDTCCTETASTADTSLTVVTERMTGPK